MNKLQDDVTMLKRRRGLALELIYETMRYRRPAHDLITLTAAMQTLGHDLGFDDMIVVLRMLRDRGYVHFSEQKNPRTNELNIVNIRVDPMGSDIVEGITRDAAVMIA